MKKNPKYLVRPSDFLVWKHVIGTKCYRPISDLKHADGSKYDHYYDFHTFEVLTNSRNKFFEIKEDEVSFYQDKCKKHYNYLATVKQNEKD